MGLLTQVDEALLPVLKQVLLQDGLQVDVVQCLFAKPLNLLNQLLFLGAHHFLGLVLLLKQLQLALVQVATRSLDQSQRAADGRAHRSHAGGPARV